MGLFFFLIFNPYSFFSPPLAKESLSRTILHVNNERTCPFINTFWDNSITQGLIRILAILITGFFLINLGEDIIDIDSSDFQYAKETCIIT